MQTIKISILPDILKNSDFGKSLNEDEEFDIPVDYYIDKMTFDGDDFKFQKLKEFKKVLNIINFWNPRNYEFNVFKGNRVSFFEKNYVSICNFIVENNMNYIKCLELFNIANLNYFSYKEKKYFGFFEKILLKYGNTSSYEQIIHYHTLDLIDMDDDEFYDMMKCLLKMLHRFENKTSFKFFMTYFSGEKYNSSQIRLKIAIDKLKIYKSELINLT